MDLEREPYKSKSQENMPENNFEQMLERYTECLDFNHDQNNIEEIVKRKKKKENQIKKIDLHGKTTTQATNICQDILRVGQSNKNYRVLLIVGKGLHSECGEGVLRDHILYFFSKENHVTIDRASSRNGSGVIVVGFKK